LTNSASKMRLELTGPTGKAMKPSKRPLALVATLLTAATASGHHSGAMFDSQKTLTLEGSVKAFQWSNPHCWIQLLVPSAGGPVEWSVEMGSTTELYRSGWRPRTLKPGDKVTVVVHPVRDQSPGGAFVSAAGPDGKPLGLPRKVDAS